MTTPAADDLSQLSDASTPRQGDIALVHVCRHGKVHNPQDVLYSRLPGFHLSDAGRSMAERLGEHFASMSIGHLRTSPLERAQETMAPIAACHPNIAVVVDWRLIEADSRMQGQVKGPYSLRLAKSANWRFLKPSEGWGEGFHEMGSRVLAAVADAGLTVGPGGHAVLVSHQGPIWAARRMVEGKFLFNIPLTRQCALASITTFSVAPDGAVRFASYEETVIT